MKAIGIIPSRYNSTRFPGKPLFCIAGTSMIQRVFEQAKKTQLLDDVYVATDDEKIFNHVKTFTDNVLMTSVHHNNGTERIAEAAEILGVDNQIGIVVNIQGDEPFIDPRQIDQVVKILTNNEKAQIATLKIKAENGEHDNPNKVKIVTSKEGKALYFSRSTIPFKRDASALTDYFVHVGIYAFRTQVLKKIVTLNVSSLEESEKLEQLRWLENDYDIYVEETPYMSYGIDTPEDVAKYMKMKNMF